MDAQPLNWLDYIAAVVTDGYFDRARSRHSATSIPQPPRRDHENRSWAYSATRTTLVNGSGRSPSLGSPQYRQAGGGRTGLIAMLVAFLAASIPMIDKRSLARRLEYGEHMKRVSGFLHFRQNHKPTGLLEISDEHLIDLYYW